MIKIQDSFTSTCSMDSFESSLDSYPNEDNNIDALIEQAWAPHKLDAIAHRWKLSVTEQGRLKDLRDGLQDILHEKNDPEHVVRFVRETNSIKGAEKMYRRFIDFRIQQVDGILQDWDPDPLLKSHFPQTLLTGCDKEGDGIWVERPGVTDCYGLYKRFGGKTLLRYGLWARESACQSPWNAAYVAEKQRAMRITCIVDLKGLNRSHVRPVLLPIFAELIQAVQNYYCGFIKKIIIVRAPAIFGLVWSLIKHCFNENMREMMVFAGSDYLSVLEEYIPDLEENLPPCLIEGGRGTIAEGMPPRLEGGPLPSPSKSLELEPPEASEVSASSSHLSHEQHNTKTQETCVQITSNRRIRFDSMSDHESMGVRGHLLAKGSF